MVRTRPAGRPVGWKRHLRVVPEPRSPFWFGPGARAHPCCGGSPAPWFTSRPRPRACSWAPGSATSSSAASAMERQPSCARRSDRLVNDGMTSLVLDLRGDPGGLINEGVKVASLFLRPGDTVAISEGRSPEHSKVYLAGLSGGWHDLRVALLVNHGTASSAELIAGALQDHDRAVVAGHAELRQRRAADHLSSGRRDRDQADHGPLVHPERPYGAAAPRRRRRGGGQPRRRR